MGPPKVVLDILDGLNDEVSRQLEVAKSIAQPGESGRAREEIIRRFLHRVTPEGFGVDTGFVFDSNGNLSRQIDIIIYHRDYHPVFEVGGVRYFMAEGVAAAIENKAAVGSRTVMLDAIDAVSSVKRLDRTGGGSNYYVSPGSFFQSVQPKAFSSQVFTAVIAQTGMTRASIADVLSEHIATNPRELWLNFFASLDTCAALYLAEFDGGRRIGADTSKAELLVVSDPQMPDAKPPLLDFVLELLNFLRVAQLIDYSPSRYFPWGTAGDIAIPLPPLSAP